MAALKHAFLARAVGLSNPGMEIQSVTDILLGDSVMVQSFPWRSIVIVAFWASGKPGENFTWTAEVSGDSVTPLKFPPVPGKIAPHGDMSAAAQLKLEMQHSGSLTITVKFGHSVVWTRRVSVHSAPPNSPTIQ